MQLTSSREKEGARNAAERLPSPVPFRCEFPTPLLKLSSNPILLLLSLEMHGSWLSFLPKVSLLKPDNSLGDYAILLYKHPSRSPLILGDGS
jgi:hypothetical protein